MLEAADCPNDIEALKAMLLASDRRVKERDDQVAGLEAQLNTRAAEIEHLKLWLRHVLAHIADHPVNRVDELLPWHCAGGLAPG